MYEQFCDIQLYVFTNCLYLFLKPIIRNATFPLPCDNITDPDLKAIFKNCDKMCNNCEFQCMRDTEKTRLLGFCAKSKVLFGKIMLYSGT